MVRVADGVGGVGGDVGEASGFMDTGNGPGIFFGSNDGYLYGVDLEGNSLSR